MEQLSSSRFIILPTKISSSSSSTKMAPTPSLKPHQQTPSQYTPILDIPEPPPLYSGPVDVKNWLKDYFFFSSQGHMDPDTIAREVDKWPMNMNSTMLFIMPREWFTATWGDLGPLIYAKIYTSFYGRIASYLTSCKN